MAALADIEKQALQKLPENVKQYIQLCFPGSFQENIKAFKRYLIKPRVMRDVSVRDLSTTILGYPVSFPMGISPTAQHEQVHDDAECATAKGAKEAGVAYTMSMWTSRTIKQVVEAVPGGLKFLALYPLKDKSVVLKLVRQAEEHGFKALVMTVDHPVHVAREDYEMSNILDGNDPHYKQNPIFEDVDAYMVLEGKQVPYKHVHGRVMTNPTATWQYIQWLTKQTKLPVIVKGVLSEQDAALAVKAGVSGILVSNHGARQMDGLIATLDALPGIVAAVRGRCEVYMDGGVRTGSDVYKALALGAHAVFIGRPVLYGLACNGADGVKQVLDSLRTELDVTMALTGCRGVLLI